MQQNEIISLKENEMSFDDHETQELQDAIERKQNLKWFGDKKQPFKKRLYSFFATLIIVLIKNFSGKLSWQFGLVLFLAITCPVGTYTSIKFIINLFF